MRWFEGCAQSAVESVGGAGDVADETLEAVSVVGFDAGGGVEGEAMGVGGEGWREREALARGLEFGGEEELWGCGWAAVDVDTVEEDRVEVDVQAKGGTKALDEVDGARSEMPRRCFFGQRCAVGRIDKLLARASAVGRFNRP